MKAPEFSRPYRLDTIGSDARSVTIAADAAERAALCARFDLLALDRLEAQAELVQEGDIVTARGRILASAIQRCIATGDPVPAVVDEPFSLRFEPRGDTAAEVELSEDALDVVEHDGAAIDLGEAVAETLALALDSFPRSPGADAALREAGVRQEGDEAPSGAFAGLRRLLEK